MNTPESLNNNPKSFLNLVVKNWESLEDSQKLVLIKIWKVLTYKWFMNLI